MSRSILRRPHIQSLHHLCFSPEASCFPRYTSSSARICSRLKVHRSIRSSTQSQGKALHSKKVTQKKEASYSPYFLFFAIVAGTAVLVDYVTTNTPKSTEVSLEEKAEEEEPLEDIAQVDPIFADMPVPSGTLGNLTPDQEQKLKEFWAITLKTFGIQDPADGSGASAVRPVTPVAPAAVPGSESAKKKEKHGLFHRKNKDSTSSSASSSGFGSSDPEDKYGQTRELQEILATSSPADLRGAFWAMVKKDHPDALLLRFLRARKWDIQKALAMMISTMNWRRNDMHVDDDIMFNGEGGALVDSQSSDPSVKKDASDFLAQLRIGKSFMHGIDKEGRPICLVRVRLHKGGEQTEHALERYTVYLIETCRLALQPPVETATIVFDMTGFTMANMDYAPVKFMIKVFEANYPESLGCVLVHKAPWIFQGIWKIIKGWLDPVVAAKVHFTNGVDDLTQYIPRSRIIRELGGDEAWEYQYIEPSPQENEAMKQEGVKRELRDTREQQVQVYEKKTFEWIHGQDTRSERDAIAQNLRDNYWRLDPIIRARSVYDRTGMIGKNGHLDFYPPQTTKSVLTGSNFNGVPPRQEASADDVD